MPWLWATLALALALAMLALGAVWTAALNDAQSAVRVQAADLARLRGLVPPEHWPALAQAHIHEDGEAADLITVVDGQGALVASSAGQPAAPQITRVADMAGGGQVRLVRSMRVPLALSAMAVFAAVAGLLLIRRLALTPLAPQADATPAPALRTLIHAFHDGVLLVDGDGVVLDGNPAACRLLGLPLDRIVGVPVRRWVVVGHGGLVSGRFETTAQRGMPPQPFPCEVSVAPVSTTNALPLWSATLRDLTERSQAEQQLQRLASFDPLTGLPNRSLFRDRLRLAIARASRTGRPMALMFLDLDRFKNVNDSLGHDVGDQLLKHVAAAITAALRNGDSVGRAGTDNGITVARLGGDEFTVIAESLRSAADAAAVAERIQRALQTPLQVGKHEIVASTSIGITVYPDDPSTPDDLLRHADQAMYQAKELGRDQIQFYSADLNERAQQRLRLEAELRHALDRGEFELAWQPKADLATNRVCGVEALLRWHRNGKPVATPDIFIRVLEETGLILPVGRWVLEQAARQVVAWRRAGLPWLRVAVNLSGRQLRQGDLVHTVGEVLEATGLPSAQLELELTESMLMGGTHHAQLLHRLSALGVQLAIDDFGTGWSSLSYLKRFNVDTLKIDRSFVRDTPHDPEDNAIATAVIALGRSLKLRVVAEGVENAEQRQFLVDNGCDEYQGWLLSRPLSARAFEAWWRQQLVLSSGAVVEHATLP